MIEKKLPSNIAIFPLSNAIFFPRTILPLNIFEDRYIQLVNECMKQERMFGMVQPKNKKSQVYEVGCLGKIISFNETPDKRFIINLEGITRFRIKKELESKKLYREFSVNYSEFLNDLKFVEDKIIKFDKDDLLKKIIVFLDKINFNINHRQLAEFNLDELISNICMISPFSTEEKQKLIEALKVEDKAKLLDEIITSSLFELQENKTMQ